MAVEAKRPKLEIDGGNGNITEDALIHFLNWCEKVGVVISSKVYVSKEGTVSDYGMLAREDIEEGEVLFSVPRSAVLYQNTTAIHSLLEKEKENLDSQSGWVPLLLSLLHEVTNSESHWKPYFSLWPDFCFLNHPMFWSEGERQRLLSGTGVFEAVHKDLVNIQHEYNTIVLPFMKSHPEFFDPQKHTLELYKKLVAFVMAYSFQEPLKEEEEDEKDPNPPMMVPVADLLNHVASHNANLEYAPGCLKMISVRVIHQGEEVFNTYGQMANWQLLHMYGFAEPFPTNTNDTADIQMMTVFKAALQAAKTEEERNLVHEKWHLLCQLEMVGEEGAFVISQSEVLTEEELHTTLKVLTMSLEEFREFKDSEGWEEEDDDEDVCALSHDKIPKLKPSWKQLLHNSILLTLQAFTSDLQADKCLMSDQKVYRELDKTEKYALHVRYGQKMLLHKLLQLSSS